MNTVTRNMTKEERQLLENILSKLPNQKARRKQAIENAFVMTAVNLLGLCLLWLFIAWIANQILSVNIGFTSQYSLLIASVLLIFSVLFAIRSTVKWMVSWKDQKPEIQEDIQNGKVVEKNFTIVDAKRFEEPEHCGLIYFLKVQGETESYVIYDSESQDLGVQNKNPFDSTFRVKRQFKTVTAPTSQLIIEKSFSGMEVSVNQTTQIWIHPDKWAQPDSWCDVPWNELERHFYGENYSPEVTMKNN